MQAIIIALAAASTVMAYKHNPAPPKQEYYDPPNKSTTCLNRNITLHQRKSTTSRCQLQTCDSYQQPSYQQKQQQQQQCYKSNGTPQYKAPEYKEEDKSPSQEKNAVLSKDIFTYNIISKTQIQITVKGDEYNSKDVCLTGEKKNYGDLAFAECSSYGSSSSSDISSWSVEEVGTGYGYDQYKTDSCVYVVFKYQDSYGKAWCVDANSNDSYGVKEGNEMIVFECKPNHKPQQWKVCEAKSYY
ncbi:hypothetical protein HDU80_005239 [Chytriomyces hyalinus]|nr:hypothetical protein HDU80_005239 [Chytriomyces hyalinus]